MFLLVFSSVCVEATLYKHLVPIIMNDKDLQELNEDLDELLLDDDQEENDPYDEDYDILSIYEDMTPLDQEAMNLDCLILDTQDREEYLLDDLSGIEQTKYFDPDLYDDNMKAEEQDLVSELDKLREEQKRLYEERSLLDKKLEEQNASKPCRKHRRRHVLPSH